MERRDFIKQACLSCGMISLLAVLPLTTLESCTTLPMLRTSSENKNIVINKSKLAADKKLFILRSDDLQYDVLLVKNNDNSYYGLYMQCTHQDNPVQANDKSLFCNAHGSTFDLSGKVMSGPAAKDLTRYTVSEENEKLIIHIL